MTITTYYIYLYIYTLNIYIYKGQTVHGSKAFDKDKNETDKRQND